jgi:murein DD-endopeptidase MepM/ murein hydrolase activator NlpD
VTSLVRRWVARWRAFAGEADRTRDASRELWARIRAHPIDGPPQPSAVPRMRWPADGRLTSRFGMRDGRMHEGIDVAAGPGTPVVCALPGTVLLAGALDVYGRLVVVAHDRHHATVYAHLDAVDVGDGAAVEAGARLGTVGASGRSFGAHLHFEVRFDGTAVDPLVFLSGPPA